MNAPAGDPRPGPPEGRSRRANLPCPRHHPPPSRAKEDGWSGTPRECPCTKIFTFRLTFPLTSFPLFLFRDAEEKKEEKKRRKKRKTGQATPGPDPAATATPTTPPRVATR
jgi:hypothetical protein